MFDSEQKYIDMSRIQQRANLSTMTNVAHVYFESPSVLWKRNKSRTGHQLLNLKLQKNDIFHNDLEQLEEIWMKVANFIEGAEEICQQK